MDSTDRETRPAGREVEVLAFGDTADELKLAAADEARPFFGESTRLTVVRDYRARAVMAGYALEKQAGGKKYHATVTVRTIEAGE